MAVTTVHAVTYCRYKTIQMNVSNECQAKKGALIVHTWVQAGHGAGFARCLSKRASCAPADV